MDVLHLLALSASGATVARKSIGAGTRRSGAPSAGRRLIAVATGEHLDALARSVAVVERADRDAFVCTLARLTESFEATPPPP